MISRQFPDERKKRKRGGQWGNRNARKHGFYSSSLDPGEICRFWNTVNLGSAEPELVALRIRLDSVLRSAPGNHRVLGEAAKLLAKWYRSKYGFEGNDNVLFKKLLRGLLESKGAEREY